MRGAAFLDRDGVVNPEVRYLHEPEKTSLLPGVAAAINEIHGRGFLVIVVTNQAGIAKGYYREADMRAVHLRIQQLLRSEGASVDAFYFCPHHPDYTGPCRCRKPAPGMLLRAMAEHDVDPARSFMVGDRLSDVYAGRAAGCRRSYLIAADNPDDVSAAAGMPDVSVVPDLSAAAREFFASLDRAGSS